MTEIIGCANRSHDTPPPRQVSTLSTWKDRVVIHRGWGNLHLEQAGGEVCSVLNRVQSCRHAAVGVGVPADGVSLELGGRKPRMEMKAWCCVLVNV